MEDAGLAVREDAMGNIFGRLEGSESDAGIASILKPLHRYSRPLARLCIVKNLSTKPFRGPLFSTQLILASLSIP